jgi:serine phosphatase RsbU (regulator of sigma subunit)
MPRLPLRLGWASRWLARPLLLAVLFAFIFLVLSERGFAAFPDYYIVGAIFSLIINAAVELNGRWVVPRLLRNREPHDRATLRIEIASYVVASMLGSAVAAVALHFTLVPDMLESGGAALEVLVWTLVFAAVVMGAVFTAQYQRRFVNQVRTDAERRAREEHELRTAAAIQQALLPPPTRSGPGYELAGASIPCRTIGGDFFDTFDLPGGALGFALGDVSGKGPPAAILAAMVQGIFASIAGSAPADTLTRINQALLRRAVEARFATVFYGVLRPEGRLVTCNAGHNPGLLIRIDGTLEKLEAGGLMVGAFDSATYDEEERSVAPGDTLVLYSDGVTDAMSPEGEQFGDERFLAALVSAHREGPEESLRRVLEVVRSFVSHAAPADDVTMLVMRFTRAPIDGP